MMGDRSDVTLVEILLHPNSKGPQWVEDQQKEKENKQIEGCTFKPQTINYQGGATRETSGDKCFDLFSTKPKGWVKDKVEKTTDEYTYEKEK